MILTSGRKAVSECHRRSIVKPLVSHVSDKVRSKANVYNSLYQTKVHNSNPAATWNVGAGELGDCRNEEDRAKPHYRSGSQGVQAVEAPGQLATELYKGERTVQQEATSLVTSEVLIKSWYPAKPTVK